MPKNVNLNHFSMWRSGKKIVGLSPNSSVHATKNMALRDLIFFKYTIGNYSIGPPRGPHRGFHRGPQRGSLGGSRGVGLKSIQKGQNGCKLQN